MKNLYCTFARIRKAFAKHKLDCKYFKQTLCPRKKYICSHKSLMLCTPNSFPVKQV